MDEKHQVEKTASDIFKKLRLDWVVASVEDNHVAHTWDVEVQVPGRSDLILMIPHGSSGEIKKALREQAEEEMDRLHIA
jgi:PhoPQ-activated pathogenicity-related protein